MSRQYNGSAADNRRSQTIRLRLKLGRPNARYKNKEDEYKKGTSQTSAHRVDDAKPRMSPEFQEDYNRYFQIEWDVSNCFLPSVVVSEFDRLKHGCSVSPDSSSSR
jgi:hypothetical protein